MQASNVIRYLESELTCTSSLCKQDQGIFGTCVREAVRFGQVLLLTLCTKLFRVWCADFPGLVS